MYMYIYTTYHTVVSAMCHISNILRVSHMLRLISQAFGQK